MGMLDLQTYNSENFGQQVEFAALNHITFDILKEMMYKATSSKLYMSNMTLKCHNSLL